MKILYVSFLEPSEKFGGGIGILKSLSALCQFADVCYVGPSFNQGEIKKYNIKLYDCIFIEINKSYIKRLYNYFMHMSASGFYDSWKNAAEREILRQKYDFVYLERSLQGFVAKWSKNNHIPLIVMTHNVEYDYFYMLMKKSISLSKYLSLRNAKSNEKVCLQYADKVICLTEYDKNRFMKIYKISDEKISIIPVCINGISDKNVYKTNKPYILITGSLWFGPNSDGTIWFLQNVWSELEEEIGDQYDLIIAGSNPNELISNTVKQFQHVTLIENPISMDSYYAGASIFVAPIFCGSGMKVKIAEAISCGLEVVSTTHALTGYEKVKGYIHCADTKEEFKVKIKNIIENSLAGNNRSQEIRDIFLKNYSMETFAKLLKKAIYGTLKTIK